MSIANMPISRKQMKQLLNDVQQFDGFDRPKVALEQYVTDAESTVNILATAYNAGHILDCVVADLGCGCGHLAAASALLGASRVIGFELDTDALATCQANVCESEVDDVVDVVQCDVCLIPEMSRWHDTFDTVIMNPPFGTKKSHGIDTIFVKSALLLAPVVYSLHKSSTRKYMEDLGEQLGARAEALAQLRFPLPATYAFHKKKQLDIEVDLIRFTRS